MINSSPSGVPLLNDFGFCEDWSWLNLSYGDYTLNTNPFPSHVPAPYFAPLPLGFKARGCNVIDHGAFPYTIHEALGAEVNHESPTASPHPAKCNTVELLKLVEHLSVLLEDLTDEQGPMGIAKFETKRKRFESLQKQLNNYHKKKKTRERNYSVIIPKWLSSAFERTKHEIYVSLKDSFGR
ncbi:hypothetical protein FRB93_000075 [Tulasnella sp. JGI-2019a]|nr:hypothetical protein FRB93_000075 [Tulasnella sp. JGI-2019a]